MGAKHLIDMQHVTKTYQMGGQFIHALDGIDLTVDQGEYIALIGPSGSGKSTLMHILGCLDMPDGGAYHLDGELVSALKDRQLSHIRNEKIGFVFQSFHLLANYTALENVELPLIYRGMGKEARNIAAIHALEKVGLADRAQHLPKELSGGQQQRVAIARALAGNPPLLLADEPTGALDSKTSIEIMQLLQQLNEAGHTILLITHDLEVARQAKRVIRIQDGNLQEWEGALRV